MILHGKNLIIKVDGTPIAAAKDCNISIQRDRHEVSSPATGDGKWKHYIFKRGSWSVSTGHLVMSITRSAIMVGTTVSLEVLIAANVGSPFNGFVSGVTIQSGSYSGTPQQIYWDKTLKKFVGYTTPSQGVSLYFETWTNSGTYSAPSDYDVFTYNNVAYTWLGNELAAEKLTGSADVLRWDCQGSVGHLATGAFEFGGNGALTPASLP